MSNLDIQNLRRSPSISRRDFHNMAAKIMGKSSDSSTVKKNLKEAGAFYGGRTLKKGEYAKKLKNLSQYLEKKGVKPSYYGRKVLQSVKDSKRGGLAKGGTAESFFKNSVKQQMSSGQPTGSFSGLEPKTQRKLISKILERGRISDEERKLLSDEGFQELKKRTEQIKSINVFYRKEEIEKENAKKSAGAQSSISKLGKENNDQKSQNSATAAQNPNKNQSSVPLQGGLGAGTNVENPENTHKIETFAPVVKELSKEKPTESPPVKEEITSVDGESKEFSDMDID